MQENQKKDKELELWTGKRLGEKKAKKRFFVDEIYASSELNKKLKEYIVGKKHLYCDLNSKDKRVKKVLNQVSGFNKHENILHIICEMRIIK